MRGPDGTTYPMDAEYVEIVPLERLVFRSRAVGRKPMFEMLTTIEFVDRGEKTEMRFNTRALMVTGDAVGPLQGMTQGWTESLERLQAEVEA